ncbi:hypothetical protein SAMN05216390_102353 [Lachnospiraceae bacterium KH1T2]|nr:hypothetical protein SAMN05216390_102353 [Lachnospiraceae bacterium KH1T2]
MINEKLLERISIIHADITKIHDFDAVVCSSNYMLIPSEKEKLIWYLDAYQKFMEND